MSPQQEDPPLHGKCIPAGDNDDNHGDAGDDGGEDDNEEDGDGDDDGDVVYDDEGSRAVHYPTTSPPLPVFGKSKKPSGHLSKPPHITKCVQPHTCPPTFKCHQIDFILSRPRSNSV